MTAMTRRSVPRLAATAVACLALSGVTTYGAAAGAAAASAVIQVTGTADELTNDGVCSLREAIMAANRQQAVDTCAAGSAVNEIVMPTGTYTLAIPGAEEDADATGDLDVASSITLTANGSIIDAGGIDRAIQILPGAAVDIVGATIRSGYLQASIVDLSDAGTSGGGIFNGGRLSLVDSFVTANTVNPNFYGSAAGGGISNTGELTLAHTQVSGNSFGGALPTGGGGGVYNLGSLTAIDSTMNGNFAFDIGGGLYNVGSATLTGTTVSGNSTGCVECTGRGGGIYNGGSLQVTNGTISGNSAGAGDYGGAASGGGLRNDGTAQLLNVTLANNAAVKSCVTHCFGEPETNGGGAANSGSIKIANTVMSGNTAVVTQSPDFGGGSVTTPSDCTGTVTSQGHNLIGASAGCGIVASTGDLLDVDPRLGPLRDNGGPFGASPSAAWSTPTHDLGAGSPAIDAGNPGIPGSGEGACAGVDQRGVSRPLDGNSDSVATCDIGAVETGSSATHPNLLQNASFDSGGPSLSPWIFRHDIAASLTVDSTDAADGAQAAKVTVSGTSTSTHLVQLRQEGVVLHAGLTYTVAFWAKASGPRVIIARLQSPIAPYPTFKAVNVSLSTTWQRFQFTYLATSDVADAFVGFNLAQTRGDVSLDGVTLTDGNLVTNGGFETGGSTLSPWIWRNDLDAGLSRDTTVKFAGAASAKITVPTAGSASHLVQLRQAIAALTPGRTYRVSFEMRASQARQANVRLQSSDAPYPTAAANTFNVTTNWKHFSFLWTPKNVVNDPFVGFNLAQSTGTIWIDEVAFVELPR